MRGNKIYKRSYKHKISHHNLLTSFICRSSIIHKFLSQASTSGGGGGGDFRLMYFQHPRGKGQTAHRMRQQLG